MITLAACLSDDGVSEIGWGDPNRAVPLVTISAVNTRSSTGTKIGEGVGGAVRAAASAGDWMVDPAIQLTAATSTTTARTEKSNKVRFLLKIALVCLLRGQTNLLEFCRSTLATGKELSLNPVLYRLDDFDLAFIDDNCQSPLITLKFDQSGLRLGR